MKRHSVFYPTSILKVARANVVTYPWAAEMQREIVETVEPWMKLSDDELWDLMFGNTITRSFMVWSNGHCPACQEDVPMYSWEIDAFQQPWKVRCPHCRELFPKNDFYQFYRSGLDEHGIFDPQRADRTLLFNVEYPDPNDPLHMFGVDDGEGYVEGDKCWRFIGAYLIYGQWKQVVFGGIRNLAVAYVLTGNNACAHKAGVLLDRLADLYPSFDGEKEILAYEKAHGPGYISTWHDACEETREVVLAYDRIFEALKNDHELVAYLAQKAVGATGRSPLHDNPKTSFEEIQRNVEDRILRDALNNPSKIFCNYPRTDITIAIIKTVLDWPGNRNEIYASFDAMLEKAIAVDGVTGEKGLASYCVDNIQGVVMLLGLYAGLAPSFLGDTLKRHPRLHEMYRFHIDTWCLQQYYPVVGDSSFFAEKVAGYVGVPFSKNHGVDSSIFTLALCPSMYTFLWQLYELTGDTTFVRVLYHANGNSVDDLPYDLFCHDPVTFQKKVQEVIDREREVPLVGSVNKQQWHLAILRSGHGKDARALWLDYDSGGSHSHADGMNLGLFAKGLDLMPDFGYPPVHYGGWSGPKFDWYVGTASHNTVVIDGQNQPRDRGIIAGITTLWADGKEFQTIRVSGPELIGGQQFERTIALIDISERDFYLVDIFRVVGGTDHAKFMHSHFGKITTEGLSLKPADEYGHGTQMRNFYVDPAPRPGWSVDWQIEDRHHYLQPDVDLHLRYTDLTAGAQAFTCEGWIYTGGFNTNEEAWLPRVMVRRGGANNHSPNHSPLQSTFVSIIEPYEGTSNIAHIRRLPLKTAEGAAYPESHVALEIQLKDGRRDLFVAADVENPLGLTPSWSEHEIMVQEEWGLRLDGEMCMVRTDAAGELQRIVMCRGKAVSIGDVGEDPI